MGVMRQGAGYAAIVLAGGAARRMGGRHKPALSVGGRSMLSRVLDAVYDAEPIVVVGPSTGVPGGVLRTRERPPGGGPVAGIAAGFAAVTAVTETTGLVAVLAADQPFLTSDAVRRLRRAAAGGTGAGAAFVDGRRPQLLCSVWWADALRGALAAVGDPRDVSVRRLLGVLPLVSVEGDASVPPPWYDCDDENDRAAAERWFRDNEEMP